jgi:integrase
LVRLIFPVLGDRPIAQIRRKEIVELLDKVEDEKGPVMADRTLALVRVVMNWFERRDEDFRSPIVRGMAKTKQSERARDRVLEDHELAAVWKASEMQGPPFGSLVKFLISTGCRRSEGSALRWDEIKDGVWNLPRERNKIARDLPRPLSKAVQQMLAEMPRLGPFVFSYDGRKPITGYSKQKRRLDEIVQAVLAEEAANADPPRLPIPMPEFVLHDLRRTAASLMQREHVGVTREVIEACLGHLVAGVAGVYQRHDYRAEMMRAYEALSREIARILTPPPDNVLPFNKAAGEGE